jgi:hypothetical protein
LIFGYLSRGGAYDTFPEVAIISPLHLTSVQKHAWQQLCQDSSIQKFYIINVVSIFFNRNLPSILYQDHTCMSVSSIVYYLCMYMFISSHLFCLVFANWCSILDFLSIAPTLRFKWNNPYWAYAIIRAILLHVSMHVLPICFSG